MVNRNNRTGGIFSTPAAGTGTRQSGTGAREFTGTEDVLDIPPFKRKELTEEQKKHAEDNDVSISRPTIRLEPFTEGMDKNDSDSIDIGNIVNDDNKEALMKVATTLSFPSKYEFNDDWDEWCMALENVIKFDVEDNPFRTTLLYGPTGTGKTTAIQQFVAQLRDKITTKEIEYLTTDYGTIQSSLVGQAEKNVVQIKDQLFNLDEEKYYILHIDEIDSLFPSRASGGTAQHRMDLTNEMIKFMDSLPQNVTLVGTTNLVDNMDSAIVRRFKTRVGFEDYKDDYKEKVLLSLLKKYNQELHTLEGIGNYKIYHLETYVEGLYRKAVANTKSKVIKDAIILKKQKAKERAERRELAQKKEKQRHIDRLNRSSQAYEQFLRDNEKILTDPKDLEYLKMIGDIAELEKNTEISAYNASGKKEVADISYKEMVFIKDNKSNKIGESIKCVKDYFDSVEAEDEFLEITWNKTSGCIDKFPVKEMEHLKQNVVEHAEFTTVDELYKAIDDMGYRFVFGFEDAMEYAEYKAKQKSKDNVVVKKLDDKETNKELIKFLDDDTTKATYINGKLYVKESLVATIAMQEETKYRYASPNQQAGKVHTINNKFAKEEVSHHNLFSDTSAPLEGVVKFAVPVKSDVYTSIMLITITPKAGVNGHGVLYLTPQEWIRNYKKKDWIVVSNKIGLGEVDE